MRPMLLPIVVSIFLGAWGLVPSSYGQHLPKSKKTRIAVTPTPGNRTETQGATDQQKNQSPSPSPSPSPVGSVSAPTPQKETSQSEKQPSQVWIQNGSSKEDLSGWALVFVGAFGVYVAWRSLKGLKEQIADGKIVAEATKKSADTAAKSAESAEQTVLRAECADVLVEDVKSSTGSRFDQITHMEIVVKNYGRTRANNVRSKTWYAIGT